MYAPNGSIPEISIDERCKLYCKVNIKDQNTSAVDSQNELKTSVQGNKNAHPNRERERRGVLFTFLAIQGMQTGN